VPPLAPPASWPRQRTELFLTFAQISGLLGFTLDGVDEAMDLCVRVGIAVDAGGRSGRHFRSVHAYKAKFQPHRAPLHLAYRRTLDLPQIGIAILRAYLSSTCHRRP
jgi:lysylphosphatidylglycerol synthetase-like protein (DUF2156 family)